MKQPATHSQPKDTATAGGGASKASPERADHPGLPHERDESSHSQANANADQKDVGRKAYQNATDGTTDTDKGSAMDETYNGKLAPERGDKPPRR